jgi:hypothetical protein
MNRSSQDALGLTIYYTARSLIRTISDETLGTTEAQTYKEEKTLSNNSLVYILGYFKKLNDNWNIGVSYRFPSLEVSGLGSYYISQVQTNPFVQNSESAKLVPTETRIPARAAVGISYDRPGKFTVSADLVHYAHEKYTDMDSALVGEEIEHKETLNFALGIEYFIKDWLRMRNGFYTNYSSHPDINANLKKRQPDRINMWGFSTNFAIFTSDTVSFTVGGYYSGGTGKSMQRINQQYQVINKSNQTFAMLVGSAYYF